MKVQIEFDKEHLEDVKAVLNAIKKEYSVLN